MIACRRASRWTGGGRGLPFKELRDWRLERDRHQRWRNCWRLNLDAPSFCRDTRAGKVASVACMTDFQQANRLMKSKDFRAWDPGEALVVRRDQLRWS